jgi:hypothetical protein
MIFGGAVITSAFVVGSAQIVVPRSCGAWRPALRAGARRRRACCVPCSLLLQLVGDLLGVGVAQVAHLRVAAALQRRVEVRDQRAQPQALRLLAAHQHAVGALVGDEP